MTRDRAELTAAARLLCRLDEPPRMVVLGSGGAVYDPAAAPPYAEASPVAEGTAYARAKLALEQDLAEHGPPGSLSLRVANAYGPGQVPAPGQGVLAHWLSAVASGGQVLLLGDGRTARDYVHVADVVAALGAVHRARGPLPPVVNVGSGRATSLDDLLAVVHDVTGIGEDRVERRPARSFDHASTWLDVSLAAEVLDWRPVVDLTEGVRQTWDVWRRGRG